MHPSTYYKRLAAGYDHEQAHTLPKHCPRWMRAIEEQEGQPLREILTAAAKAAPHTGYTCADLAREWGLHKDTLGHWCRKWGIVFPIGASALQREAAKATIDKVNQRKRK